MKKKPLVTDKLFASACYLVSALHKIRDRKRKFLIPMLKHHDTSPE